MPTVAFQGERGAYSEQAAITHFQDKCETKPCRTLSEVFMLVENGTADYGTVPAENSLEGSVTQTYDLLLQSKLSICGETEIRIQHCLLSLPGTSLNEIRTVYSHPQALAQCSNFLAQLDAETLPAYDTAGSAKMLKEKRLENSAVIASERAAEIYGLEILRRNIEDTPENYTRFFLIGKDEPKPTGNDKTTIVFGVEHLAGSLYRVLGELADRGINLTKIESRPTKATPWEYHFFVDFEGNRIDANCATALERLKGMTTFLRILGSYPRVSR